MKNVDIIHVSYHDRAVGRLALTKNHRIAFCYEDSWIQNGFSISPFSLPLRKEVFIAAKPYFQGLFGVFADSLPDAWGQLLVDRLWRKQGVDPGTVSALDRLAAVGSTGMGALTYEPELKFGTGTDYESLDMIAEECAKLLKTHNSEKLELLRRLGGSSGGTRPKVTIASEGTQWLVKFPARMDPAEIGVMEYEYSKCAEKCGIEVPPVKLFPSDSCGGYFGIRRFDTCDGVRKHMLTAAAMLELDYRAPCLDYTELFKLSKIVSRNHKGELKELYRRMCFNVFAHNRDDHAKNFTWLYDEQADTFFLSPAYDLTYSTTYFGEHTTSVGGNGKNPGKAELVKVGTLSGLSRKFCEETAGSIAGIVSDCLGHRLKRDR